MNKIIETNNINISDLQKIESLYFARLYIKDIYLQDGFQNQINTILSLHNSKINNEYKLQSLYKRLEMGYIFVVKSRPISKAIKYENKKYTVIDNENKHLDFLIKTTINKKSNFVNEYVPSQSISNTNYHNHDDEKIPEPKSVSSSTASSSLIEKNKAIPANKKTATILDYLVYFRTHDSYKGEFGFDWLRIGDSGKKADKYSSTYENAYGFILQNSNDYESIKNQYNTMDKTFKYKQTKQSNIQRISYHIPKLTIFPNQSIYLQLVEPKNLDRSLQNKLSNIKLESSNKDIVLKQNNKGLLTITTNGNTFSEKVYIYAKLDDELVGQIEILPNDDIVDLEVVVVKVQIGQTGKFRAHESEELSSSLKQAYVNVKLHERGITLNLTNDNTFKNKYLIRGKIKPNTKPNNYLNSEFKKQYPNEYGKYNKAIKLFVFATKGLGTYVGEAGSIGSYNVAVFSNRKINSTIVSHEILHALGLHHSFDKHAKYPFKQSKTRNIMDYGRKLYFSNSWQWKKVHNTSKIMGKK